MEREDGAESADTEVWPDNWPVLQLFLAVETQWRVQLGYGVALHLGLDYPGVETVMRRLRIRDRDGELFAALQVMERAALPILNEARECTISSYQRR